MELSIDTATDWASLALSRQGELVAELTWHCGQKHLVELFPNIRSLLSVARIQTRDLTAINVCRGPGSFNGVRVGVSAAKGLALGLGIPVVGVSTLEVEAFAYAPSGLPVCPVQEAGRGELATALFQQGENGWQRLWDAQLLPPAALARRTTRRTIFCGQIRPELKALLESSLGKKAIVVSDSVRRAGYLARLGWRGHSAGNAEDAAALQAFYLRPPAITQRQKP